LVAYFCEKDARYQWAVEQFKTFVPPVFSCEPVLTEACFLLARAGIPEKKLLDKVRSGVIHIGLRVDEEASAIGELIERYRNIPMSLADACMVRLAEISNSPICTLDSDFLVYRKRNKEPLALIIPAMS
jgi:predicted nucleic acid-binding protein